MSSTPMGEPGTAAGSPTTPDIRAVLEALVEACDQALTSDKPDFVRLGRSLDAARATLAAASPEPERPCPDGDSCPDARRYGSIHPAPTPPSVEALRDALVRDVVNAYQVDALGTVIYDSPSLRDRLDAIIAAARADERTRLAEQGR